MILKRVKNHLRAEWTYVKSAVIHNAEEELDEYFFGKRRSFDIPLCTAGSDFQETVWNGLLKVPYGQTLTYKEEAATIDNVKAFRAVANANRANALVLFIPCHRIIGSDHAIGGYSGGRENKLYLLQLEQYYLGRDCLKEGCCDITDNGD